MQGTEKRVLNVRKAACASDQKRVQKGIVYWTRNQGPTWFDVPEKVVELPREPQA